MGRPREAPFFVSDAAADMVAPMRILLIAVLCLLPAATSAAASAAPPKSEALSVLTAKGERRFTVEVVREEADRNRGLMFRKSLAADAGMLFDYDPPQEVSFWMKNTLIPLDIIFIGTDGRIIKIAARTTPLSLEPIPSGGVVRGVFEIKGGGAAKLGINVGDRVRHPIFPAE